MVRANVKILEELKVFLDLIARDPALRRLISLDDQAFTRKRKLPLQQLVGLLINQPKRSLSVELREFFAVLNTPAGSCTKGAFSLQRAKLSPVFFHAWNKCLVDQFYLQYGKSARRWRSFIVQAVDGSAVYLMKQPALAAHYGCQHNNDSAVPMARAIQVQDILNNITVWGSLNPIHDSEPLIMARHIHRLATDSLTLFDRGYPGYGLMYLMINQEVPRHFVMRCQSNFNKEVVAFLAGSKSSQTVDFFPGKEAIHRLGEQGVRVRADTALKIRMVKIPLPGGQTEVLLTSLYDEKLYSVQDLYELYGLRWKIETHFSKQKNQQQLEQFSGHRVICIQQDYAASLFVGNLQSLIEKQCQRYLKKLSKKRKYPYAINTNVSWAALKNNIVSLILEQPTACILRSLQKLFEQCTEPIRPGRTNPRRVHFKRKKGKFQTYTNYKRAI